MAVPRNNQAKYKKKRRVGNLLVKIIVGFLVLNSAVLLFNYFGMPELQYRKALKLAAEGQAAAAIKIFTQLGPYKDSKAQLLPLYDIVNRYAGVGDLVYFGTYEQDNDTTNGKEKITWKVLATGQDAVLLVSQNNLDCVPFGTTDKAVTWETSYLRAWLNAEFLNAAFNAEEQAAILETRVESPDNTLYQTKGGNTVDDKIFVLSPAEAGQYFAGDEARMSKNTAYALENRAANSPEGTGWWWLRTLGIHENIAANVNTSGTIDEYGNYVYSIGGCVRPVLWARQSGLHR
jgi:hypothetical protein